MKDTLDAKSFVCDSGTAGGTHGARFTAGKGKQAVVLVISYISRYDANSSLDLWEVYGYVEKGRVSLIGVGAGEDGVYDPATGIAAAPGEHFIVRVAVQSSADQQSFGDGGKLVPVLEAALVLGQKAVASAAPTGTASPPVIAP
ncbi:hypothetical protein [Actinocorallia aurea]